MDGAPTLDGSLDALVAGKRAAPRRAVALDAVVKGVRGEFRGRLRDLSVEGARVAIPLAALGAPDDEPLGPAEQFSLLEHHFRDSFDIHLPDPGVVVEAQVVRLVVTAQVDEAVELGCRFVEPLTAHQQTQLGLRGASEPALGWDEALALHDVCWTVDPARPATALLVDDRETHRGPLLLGPVVAVGKRALIVRFDGVEADDALARLAGPGVRVRVLRGTAPLAEHACEPVTVRYVDGPRPGADVLLACAGPIRRPLRRHLRRA